MPKLTITEAEAEAKAVELVAPAADRFARVGRMLVDLSAVVAIELYDAELRDGGGGGVLHLSGGQAVELPAEGTMGVLKRLGVKSGQGRARARGGEGAKARKKKSRPRPLASSRHRSSPAAVARGLLPAIAGFFS